MTDVAARPARPIDPFARVHDGTYRDELVEVRAGSAPLLAPVVHTTHFDVGHVGSRLHVAHRVPPAEVDDDLAGLLDDQLFGPGWLRGPELFERIVTGVVRTSHPDPVGSWELFYRNTLARIDDAVSRPAPGEHGSIADYAPVYARAEALLAPGSVLELGACFGFLSLRVARSGRRTTASDLAAGTMAVLGSVAPALGVPVDCRVADAGRYPGADGCADTVLVVHLLEHLDADHGARVLAEAVRLARRRVVVAVPLEEVANETYGHLRTVSLADLDAWGAATGLAHRVEEHHGGWLVLDR